MRIIQFLFLVLLTTFSSMVIGSGEPDVEELLWWLPTDTETLIVVRGPFIAPNFEPDSVDNLVSMLQGYAVGSIGSIRHGAAYKQLMGQKVLLSLEGSKRFRSPSALGLMPYDGCQVLLMEKDIKSFFKSVSNLTNMSIELEGHRVLVFKEVMENDKWSFFVAAPRSNILLVATDQNYLQQVLQRINHRLGTRSFEENLPEWKFIDRKTPYWALRHYRASIANQDPSSPLLGVQAAANHPDLQAIGLVFQYNPAVSSMAKVTYLSHNSKSVEIARTSWTNSEGKLKPVVEPLRGEGAKISVPIGDPLQATRFMFLLMAALGHGIFL